MPTNQSWYMAVMPQWRYMTSWRVFITIFLDPVSLLYTLLYAKQVVEEQAAYYATIELFDHNLGYKVTSKLVSGVQEFFCDIKTEEQLNYGMLPSTPKFNTYLQLLGMGISQVPPPLAPPQLTRPLHISKHTNQQQHSHSNSLQPPVTKEHASPLDHTHIQSM